MSDDLGEHHDLAAPRKQMAAQMSERMDRWLKSVETIQETLNPYYRLNGTVAGK